MDMVSPDSPRALDDGSGLSASDPTNWGESDIMAGTRIFVKLSGREATEKAAVRRDERDEQTCGDTIGTARLAST